MVTQKNATVLFHSSLSQCYSLGDWLKEYTLIKPWWPPFSIYYEGGKKFNFYTCIFMSKIKAMNIMLFSLLYDPCFSEALETEK